MFLKKDKGPRSVKYIIMQQYLFCKLPSSVPSSPMIIFIDDITCIETGADMEDAYAALWELPLIWSIISCEINQ